MIVNLFGCLIDWILSRSWLAILGLFSLPLGLPVVIGVSATLGTMRDSRTLASEYLERGERELNATSDDWLTDFTEAEEAVEIPRFTEALFRRARQLRSDDRRTNFIIAAVLGQRGAWHEAERLMREIAPAEQKGYPPAHAWLAIHVLTRTGVTEQQQLDQVLHDFEVAASWPGASTRILTVYAEVLERIGRVDQALSILRVAAKADAELQVQLAAMAMRHDRGQAMRQVADEAKRRLGERIDSDEATVEDHLQLANLLLLEKKPNEAIEVARRGMQLDSSSPRLRRMISEGLRIKYVEAMSSDGSRVEDHLQLLDAALRMDPTNPAVTEEVAKLIASGETASETLNAALRERLADGEATAMTHLVMASGKLKRGEIEAALPNLELAYQQAPNAPVILNNLAMALALARPSEIERSRELIERAIRIDPRSAEYRDTRAQVLEIQGDLAAAIKSYEQAIQLDPSRINTREKLAEAYQEFGLDDLASDQRRRIAELENADD